MKIYTKTGDAGQTGLLGGGRVSKDALRIEAYGTVDELNAQLGLTRTELAAVLNSASGQGLWQPLDDLLVAVQNELFDLGAQLAAPEPALRGLEKITDEKVEVLEKAIDSYDGQLPQLRQFILPGGTPLAAQLHVARTVCRRAERRVVSLAAEEPLAPQAIIYLNRLSDLLFVLARWANLSLGQKDVFWEAR